MGLFDFAKDLGKKLFGSNDDPAAKIEESIAAANPGVDDLGVKFEDGVVHLSGKAARPRRWRRPFSWPAMSRV